MPNGTYGGVRGRETKVIGGKFQESFVFLLLDCGAETRRATPVSPEGCLRKQTGVMVPPAAAVATTSSASDSNLRRCKEEWFRLQTVVATPDLHRFLISGPDLGIDATPRLKLISKQFSH